MPHSLAYFNEQTFGAEWQTQTSTAERMGSLSAGEYDTCQFENLDLSNQNLSGLQVFDGVFLRCNLSMVEIEGMVLRNVVFRECKLLGVRFDYCNSLGMSVSFENCQMNHSSFYQMELPKTHFKGCEMREVDFVQADFCGSLFENCNLAGAIFNQTILEKADFRSSINYQIHPIENRIRKAKFSYPGVLGLLDSFDIRID